MTDVQELEPIAVKQLLRLAIAISHEVHTGAP